MSLNHVIVNNLKYDPKLNARFKTVLIDDNIEFNDGLTYNGQLLTQVEGGVNTLYFRDQNGVLIPLAPGGKMRTFQQLANNFTIGVGTGFISMFDITDAIGKLQVQANTIKVGNTFNIEGHGEIFTGSANQICEIELSLGPASLVNSGNIILPNLPSGSYYDYRIESITYQTGSLGTAIAKTFGYIHFTNAQGVTKTEYLESTNNISYETDVTQSFDLNFRWISTNPGDNIIVHTNAIYKIS